ncbi:MAG: hypothetical protein ACK4FB_08960 [Brevundimonas sp.]|uniref:hypothetical protein n=1 Tax=Brevundimonas sp. TaxID=1871086 RepID=UPI003918E541
MTHETQTARITAFADTNGEAWGIIEFAGHDGERHTGALFRTHSEAVKDGLSDYEADERESLHVHVARWDRANGFWTYDH